MALIEIKNLTKTYEEDDLKTVALDNVDLKINEGEFVAIVGPSGSGKSTLLQVLGCLDRPTAGQYFLEGKEISNYSDNELAAVRNKEMGFVFQAFNLLPRLSVLENVKMPLTYGDIKEPDRTKVAEDMVELVGLKDRINYPTSKLSGGQKQRVAIARALANDPKVIFADEPTGSLDSKSGKVVLEFLQELHKKGRTIVLVTHESYVAECAQRILHIYDGKIEKDQDVQAFRKSSMNGDGSKRANITR
jgi:putative ABC transport system ATP-binding protein